MTRPRGANSDHPGVPRDEIDRLYDRALTPEQRRALVSRLRRDPAAMKEVIETDRMVRMLKRPIPSPDLTARVLHRVERRRGFLPRRLRRRVRQGRTAVVVGALLALLVLAFARRVSPDSFRLVPEPTPVADLGRAVMEDSAEGRRVLDGIVERIEPVRLVEGDGSPVGTLGLAEFHVEPVDDAEPRRIVLMPTADTDLMTEGVSWHVADAPTASLAFDAITPEMLQDNPSLRAFGSVALLAVGFDGAAGQPGAVPGVVPGVVPLSARHGASAYVGRRDPFRDGELKLSQPDH